MTKVGYVRELVRYPVKSMAGVPAESAELGWYGLEGDRRLAFRRTKDQGGFPWLSASRYPDLILFTPIGLDESSSEVLPTHVRTPSGEQMDVRGEKLQRQIAEACGYDVELMQLKHGMFDDGAVSVINVSTIEAIGAAVEADLDRRRFRANVIVEADDPAPFLEDEWVGGALVFGDHDSAPAVSITRRDVRCMMINLDPDTAKQDGRIMKAVVRLNANNAGVYGTVLRTGTLAIGQTVSFRAHR